MPRGLRRGRVPPAVVRGPALADSVDKVCGHRGERWRPGRRTAAASSDCGLRAGRVRHFEGGGLS
jgi:hypothetical protein